MKNSPIPQPLQYQSGILGSCCTTNTSEIVLHFLCLVVLATNTSDQLFSHSSCSCDFLLPQFQKSHCNDCKKRLPEQKKEKKSHFPLEEIILPAQSFVIFHPPPQKLYCNGSNHAGVFFVFVFVFAAPMTRRRFPLQ